MVIPMELLITAVIIMESTAGLIRRKGIILKAKIKVEVEVNVKELSTSNLTSASG